MRCHRLVSVLMALATSGCSALWMEAPRPDRPCHISDAPPILDYLWTLGHLGTGIGIAVGLSSDDTATTSRRTSSVSGGGAAARGSSSGGIDPETQLQLVAGASLVMGLGFLFSGIHGSQLNSKCLEYQTIEWERQRQGRSGAGGAGADESEVNRELRLEREQYEERVRQIRERAAPGPQGARGPSTGAPTAEGSGALEDLGNVPAEGSATP
jgi:hypothetical protein